MHTFQPNSRHCFVCGIANPFGLGLRFYQTGLGEVAAEVTVPEHFQGYPGIVHGGVVAAMLDEIAGRAHSTTSAKALVITSPRWVRTRRM